MATRKIDPALIQRFESHRIWHFIRSAKVEGQESIDFHHPVSNNASKTYGSLFPMLTKLGYNLHPVPPEGGFGNAVGVMRISGINKGKLPDGKI